MAASMVFAFSTVALAASENPIETAGGYSELQTGGTADWTQVISVSVNWGSLAYTNTFTYNAVDKKFTAANSGVWTAATDADKITVTNNSNILIKYSVGFTPALVTGLDSALAENFTEAAYTNAFTPSALDAFGDSESFYQKITAGVATAANSSDIVSLKNSLQNLGTTKITITSPGT